MNVDKRPKSSSIGKFLDPNVCINFRAKIVSRYTLVMSTSLAVIKKLRLNMMILIYTFAARYTYARNETKLGMKRKPTVISCG